MKQLREITGAGMMDCKRALSEANGDMAEAEAALKKKGIATAAKKAGRIAAEGAVGSYIHNGSRLGVLIEVNCETDFVARGPIFKELIENLAMQVCLLVYQIFVNEYFQNVEIENRFCNSSVALPLLARPADPDCVLLFDIEINHYYLCSGRISPTYIPVALINAYKSHLYATLRIIGVLTVLKMNLFTVRMLTRN